jgi:crotonobetainyl-CoA:carnitine CoA-transferase CaiB-like acyl-CoA transferase
MPGPLSGLRVVDLSRILAGPWATQFFADLGADVIKVERPGSGDDTRQWGPPWLKDESGRDTRESAYFLSCNRGKRSIALDIARTEDQDLIRSMLAESDVLVENFKVGSLVRYGLDFASLHALFPRLIYCSISGFGQTGPNAHRAGYDAMIQAEAGLMSVTGEPDGAPMKTGVAVADLGAGMYAAASILAALYARERSGLGQHIDIALYDVQVASLANQAMNQLLSGANPVRCGNAHPNIVPYQVFAVADGRLMVAVGNDQQFRSFCFSIGLPELADDERFVRNSGRVAHRSDLIELIQTRLQQRPLGHWHALFEAAGIPCGQVNPIDQVMQSEQVSARGLLQHLKHPQQSDLPTIGNPVRFSGTPLSAAQPPPLLDQHGDQIRREFEPAPDSGRRDAD